MKSTRGVVYLVGAGPGDPDLITVRGLKLLRSSDVVLHDRLIPHELLRECPPETELLNVSKAPGRPGPGQEEINRILIDRALQGKQVVRLKGGDPFIFGRGGEEMEACRRAGVRYVIVPGVSSALAAPASVGIPLTYREKSRSFAVVTAHSNGQGPQVDYRGLATIDTVVILMGRSSLSWISRELIRAGRDSSTPAVCVEWATTPAQRMAYGPLISIAEEAEIAGLMAPVVTIVGEVAAMALKTGHPSEEWWSEFRQGYSESLSWIS
jgi:uroporphyrin-III C-methyltransferase